MASVWAMDPIQTGWLLKKKHGPTLFGDPWQRRWFSMHRVSVESDVESSVHDNWQVVQFVLHYHTSEKEFEAHKMSGQKLPRKPTALDPSYPARREHSQDTAGRYCFSLMNSDDGSILVLAAESPETAAKSTPTLSPTTPRAHTCNVACNRSARPLPRLLQLTRSRTLQLDQSD
jgi:hypothetical protein